MFGLNTPMHFKFSLRIYKLTKIEYVTQKYNMFFISDHLLPRFQSFRVKGVMGILKFTHDNCREPNNMKLKKLIFFFLNNQKLK